MQKLLIPIQGDYVAPRFDLASEVIILRFSEGEIVGDAKTIIMERPSEDELCQLVVEANISDLICGAIEEQHYNFLVWKRVKVFDSIIGGWRAAVDLLLKSSLEARQIIEKGESGTLSL